MRELYLEVFSSILENGLCLVPLETAIVLFVYEYCDNPPLLITFVKASDAENRPHFKLNLSNWLFKFLEEDDNKFEKFCKLPLMVTNAGTTCVGGLCAVLRRIIKIVDTNHRLLGFKQGCLYGCAETSAWTRFCEVDLINTVNDLFMKTNWSDGVMNIPWNLALFETHLGRPVKAHNIQKQKLEVARQKGLSHCKGNRLDLLQDLEHTYSEGYQMTLADLILLPCFHSVFQLIGSAQLDQCLPLTRDWYNNLMKNETIKTSIKFMAKIEHRIDCKTNVNYYLPNASNESLYNGENRSSKGKRHFFTKQELIESGFESASNLTDDLEFDKPTFGHDIKFDWSSIPIDVQLIGDDFPEKRLQRKLQQLQNMTKAVLKIAKDGDRIVDFCCGSGHLGLVLAYSLPRCTIILLENKEESLKRAQTRAEHLHLTNLIFCQSNIDYFRGDFDIGVSLHACGVATDLVMEKCLLKGASFVCCPCCYGSIRPNHAVAYPRSEKYRKSLLSMTTYLTLAHASDQTHDENNLKTSQGKRCMAIIDNDRCLRAKEKGYSVSISTMEPPSCTPKNNLLVGISPKNQ